MAADAEATLPALIEAVQAAASPPIAGGCSRSAAKRWPRRTRHALERARAEAAYAWDATPISTARLTAELWAQIKNEDWALVSESGIMQRLDDAAVELRQALPVPRRLGRRRRRLRRAGGGRRRARQQEARPAVGRRFRATATSCTRPACWWTAAHHRIPLLAVMHNNRAYHQEVMHLQRMAQPPQPRHHARAHRHDDRRPERRLREDRAGHGRARAGTDHEPERSRRRRSGARSRSSSAASRRSSTSSRSRGDVRSHR